MRHPRGSLLIETHRFHFHQPRMLPRRVHSKRSYQPERLALQKSFYVFAANEWDVISKPLSKCGEQTVAVRGLFRAHLLKHLRRGRIRFAQLVRKLPKNSSILFFVLNRQRQNFALGQILEFLEHSPPLGTFLREKNRTTPPRKSSST